MIQEKEISQHLKRFKRIMPRAEFAHALKQELLSSHVLTPIPVHTRTPWNIIRLATSFALAGLIVAIGIGIYGGLRQDTELAGLNNEEILSELASSGDINIYINEIEYYDEAHKTIDVALNEISKGQKNQH